MLSSGHLDFSFFKIFVEEKLYNAVKTNDTCISKSHEKMFNNVSSVIYQTFIEKSTIKNFNLLEKKLPISVEYISMIKQVPGSFNATHFDKFHKLDNKKNKVFRINVFLSEWVYGQVILTPEKNFSHWNVGDYCMWDETVQHTSINFSLYEKLTLQISGYLK